MFVQKHTSCDTISGLTPSKNKVYINKSFAGLVVGELNLNRLPK